jgi:hypothetical protein
LITPTPRTQFVIDIFTWVQRRDRRGRTREVLEEEVRYVTGTLSAAKASLAHTIFFTAKIYEHGNLVATLQGTQPNPNPQPIS